MKIEIGENLTILLVVIVAIVAVILLECGVPW
jgi:hypothetical protein